jgi:hypothetical protein
MKTHPLLIVSILLSISPLSVSAQQCRDLFSVVHNTTASTVLINDLMERAVTSGPLQAEAKRRAQEVLKLDDMNFTYYLSLYQKNKANSKAETIKLFPATDGRFIGYPVGTPTTPKEIEQQFKYVNYGKIKEQFDGRYAKSAVLLLKKLQAGTGSSMTRQKYFEARPEMAQLLGIKPGTPIKLGAKGTDLLVTIDHPLKPGTSVEISIAELQLLQVLEIAKSQTYSEIILQDIVGPETQNRLSQIWQKKSLLDPNLTYAQVFDQVQGAGRAQAIFQSHVPALNEQGQISFNRYAPAGHGLFAVDALRAVLNPQMLPKIGNRKLISAIANGEDLNSLPDPVIIDWTVKNRIPIVLVTTSKIPIDVKGGLLTLVKDTQTGETYLKVIDTAEAKAAGQIATFEKSAGFASTNLTLFNYEILTEKLKGMSEQELLTAMAPDLVPNWKEQKDADGVYRKYLQLEGTMGTTIMNLDRYYRKKHGEALVYVVNIEAERRSDFFSPIKSAFDYFLQFHSDRFSVDKKTYKLQHRGGAELPNVVLKDPATKDAYYQDVQNVLHAFKNTSVRNLKDLQVTGQALFQNMILQGKVIVINETSQVVDLNHIIHRLPKADDGRPLLNNIEIKWSQQGISITEI